MAACGSGGSSRRCAPRPTGSGADRRLGQAGELAAAGSVEATGTAAMAALVMWAEALELGRVVMALEMADGEAEGRVTGTQCALVTVSSALRA